MKISIIALAIFCLILPSCKKDKTSSSKEEMLTGQAWIATAFTRKNLATGAVQDMYAPMTACYRDDQQVFRANGEYEGNAGAVKCAPADPQIYQLGSWRFKDNETIVELIISSGTSGIGTYNYKILSLTPSVLSLYLEDGGYGYNTVFSH